MKNKIAEHEVNSMEEKFIFMSHVRKKGSIN